MTPKRLDDFGSESNESESEAPDETSGRHDAERTVEKRARFLEASTQLDTAEARTLAWRQAGYSKSGIAKKVGSTEATVAERLDRITARYGIDAVLSKQPDERGQTPLSPATPDEIAAFPWQTQAEWRELAEQYPERAPEWFDDPERDPTFRGRHGRHPGRRGEQGGDGQ